MAINVELHEKKITRVGCPYCGCFNRLDDLPKSDTTAFSKIERNYSRTFYETRSYFSCKECGKLVFLSHGTSSYTTYADRQFCSNKDDILILADFMSECYDNFSIYKAVSVTNRPKYYYFILGEKIRHPIFITKERAKEFIGNYKAAFEYIRAIRLARYNE